MELAFWLTVHFISGLVGSLILTWYIYEHDVDEENVIPILTGVIFGHIVNV